MPQENNMDTQQPYGTDPMSARPSAQSSDLYNQIAGEDKDVLVEVKKKQSLVMELVVLFMRAALYMDALRRTYEPVFRVLSVLWTVFMSLLYFSGILIVIFAVYNRLQLPIYLEDQLREREVQYESAEFGMDRIIVNHLTAKDNSYSVNNIVIYSTFADLLQKRIRFVELDGLRVYLDTNSDVNIINELPKILSQIQNPTQNRLDMDINALTISNAKLIVRTPQKEIPITFSMEAIYGSKMQIVMPLTLEEPSLQVQATLTTDGSSENPEWILTIAKGSITLPRSSPENIKGVLRLNMEKQQIKQVQADFQMGYGTIEKNIVAKLNSVDENDFMAQILWQKNNLTEPDLSSQVAFDIEHLSFINATTFKTWGQFYVKIPKLYGNTFDVTELSAPLKMDLVCENGFNCVGDVKQEANITIKDVGFVYENEWLVNTEIVQLKLMPQEKALILKEGNPWLSFSLPINNLIYEGKTLNTENKINVEVADLTISGDIFEGIEKASRLSVLAKELKFNSPNLLFEKGEIKANNLLDQTASFTMFAQEVRLPDLPLLSHPFELSLTMLGQQSEAKMAFNGTPISLIIQGYFKPQQKTFEGQIKIPPFNLSELTVSPTQLWPDIPSSVRNLSGKMAVYGKINWSSAHNIQGPLYIGLKDVSFDTRGVTVSGVNSVLTVDSLLPFVIQKDQHLTIQSIDGVIPFQDIDMFVQFKNDTIRINNMSLVGGGIPLSVPATVIPTKGANLLVYMKNIDPMTPEQFERAVKLNGLKPTAGTANISIPLSIQENKLSIPNITLKMQNVLLKRDGEGYNDIFGKEDNYFIRNGQIILDNNRIMQLVLNGRLLPSRTTKDVQLNKVELPASIFRPLSKQPLPKDIQQRQNALFGN